MDRTGLRFERLALKRGDVVIVVHGEFGRPRPAVIVQADELGATTTVLVCPITSDVTEKLPVRPILDMREGSGLHRRSQIMTGKVVAVRRDGLREVIGAIDTETAAVSIAHCSPCLGWLARA